MDNLAALTKRYVGREILVINDRLASVYQPWLKTGNRWPIVDVDMNVKGTYPCIKVDLGYDKTQRLNLVWVKDSGYGDGKSVPCLRLIGASCGACGGLANKDDYLCEDCRG